LGIENSLKAISLPLAVISNDPQKTFGNFPNPFGRPPYESTQIRFLLQSTSSDVKLEIFSLAGELVKSNWNQNLSGLPKGLFYIKWDGKNDRGYKVLNGVYLCTIEIRGASETKRFMTKIAYIK
jgi:flagellar hook assembly protein FlgD